MELTEPRVVQFEAQPKENEYYITPPEEEAQTFWNFWGNRGGGVVLYKDFEKVHAVVRVADLYWHF